MTTIDTAVLQTGHVGLNVTDLARSRAFYEGVFGFSLLGGSDEAGRRFAFLGDPQRIVLTLWEQGSGGFDGTRSGVHHLSFQVGTMEEVRAAEAMLRGLEVKFTYDGIVPHGEGAPDAWQPGPRRSRRTAVRRLRARHDTADRGSRGS